MLLMWCKEIILKKHNSVTQSEAADCRSAEYVSCVLTPLLWFLCSHCRTGHKIKHTHTQKTQYHPWYVSTERVWHALRACVVNSNGTTDPQLDLWADSTHPPTRPSVLLCIGKQARCMLMSTEDTHVIHPAESQSELFFLLFLLLLLWCILSLQHRCKQLLCPQGDNNSLHHSVVADHYRVFTLGFFFSLSWACSVRSATSCLGCRFATCLLEVNYPL